MDINMQIEDIEQKYSNDLIQSELYATVKKADRLSAVEFLLCNRELKEMWLKDKKKDIGIIEFNSCDDELRKINITNIFQSERTLPTTKFRILSDELKAYYFSLVITERKLSVDYNIFIEASDSQKIEYILHRGLENVSYDIRDWYVKWRKIKRRDLNIDKILLEE